MKEFTFVLSFPSVVIGIKKSNDNNGSLHPAGRQLLRDDGNNIAFSGRTANHFSVASGGFTLIELLVVVLIIGILAAMALSSYRVAVGTSRVATMYALVRSVDQAQQHFYMQTGRYASNLESLIIAMPAGFTKRSWSIENNKMLCQLVTNEAGNAFRCDDKTINLGLEKYYHQSYFRCWTNPDNELGKRICANISGQDTWSGQNSKQVSYFIY